jgi:Tfp pilus assembly protein PilZ
MQKATAQRREDPSEDVLRRMRIPFIRRATLVCEGFAEEVFLVDLALSGAFVERPNPLAVGATVELSFCLPENEIPLVVSCRVAWCHTGDTPLLNKSRPNGAGLEFVASSPVDQERLRRHLTDYYHRDPGSRRFVGHDVGPSPSTKTEGEQ